MSAGPPSIGEDVLGELERQGARWLVAGHAEPPATAHALELARKNAAIYVERLDAELSELERNRPPRDV